MSPRTGNGALEREGSDAEKISFEPDHKYGNWQKYNNRNPLQRYLIGQFLDAVAEFVVRSQAESVADVGCAEGFVMRHIRRGVPSLHWTGIDLDAAALKRGRALHGEYPVQQASVYALPYAAHSVDLVLCTEVLEHLEDPVGALNEIKRVARRYCVLSVPHEPFFRIANLLRAKSLSRFGDDVDHINHWGKESFRGFLERNGLFVLETRSTFPWLVTLAEVRDET